MHVAFRHLQSLSTDGFSRRRPEPQAAKITNYFVKLPSNEPRELPHCLQRYQPTSVPRRPARPKRPVGRPRKTPRESSAADSDNPEPCGLSESAAELSHGVLRGLPTGRFGRAGRRGTDVGWYRCRQCGNSRGSFEGSFTK